VSPLDDGKQHQILEDRLHPAHHVGEAQEVSDADMGTSAGPTMSLWGDEPSSCAAPADGYADFMREQDEAMSFGPDVSDLPCVMHWQHL